MSLLITCLWFNGQAEDAAAFYTGLILGARIVATTPYPEGAPRSRGKRDDR